MRLFLNFHVHVIYQIIITFMKVGAINVIIQVMNPSTLIFPRLFYVQFRLFNVLHQRTSFLLRIIRFNADYKNVPTILRLMVANVLTHRLLLAIHRIPLLTAFQQLIILRPSKNATIRMTQ